MRWPWTKAAEQAEERALNSVTEVDRHAEDAYGVLRQFVIDTVEGLNKDMTALGERIDDITPLPKPPIHLDIEERGRMQMVWATSVCPYCQHAHSGVCPRVRRIEYDTRHLPMRVWFWPEGRWHLPDDALSVEDVFGTGASVPAEQRVKGESNG